jgi:hypothetical protein
MSITCQKDLQITISSWTLDIIACSDVTQKELITATGFDLEVSPHGAFNNEIFGSFPCSQCGGVPGNSARALYTATRTFGPYATPKVMTLNFDWRIQSTIYDEYGTWFGGCPLWAAGQFSSSAVTLWTRLNGGAWNQDAFHTVIAGFNTGTDNLVYNIAVGDVLDVWFDGGAFGGVLALNFVHCTVTLV